MLKNGLYQYAEICTDAIKKSGAKVTNRIEKIPIEVLFLYMIIPRKTRKKNSKKVKLETQKVSKTGVKVKKRAKERLSEGACRS